MENFLNFDTDGPSRIFFFDTETTGLPTDWKAPVTRVENWPRMVQFAWILTDGSGNEIASANHIIQPQGYTIPAAAARVHGITTERALAEGIPVDQALHNALPQIESADTIIAHNISFDEKIFGAECLRLELPLPFEGKTLRCTMKEATRFCAIPGFRGGYKYPNLTELHRILFNRGFDNAHDALADVRACRDSYFELKLRGILD